MLLRMFYLSCELVCTWTQLFAPRITTKLDDQWRTYISPFPPNQSLQLILDLDDPNKINKSIFSAVSSCVLWRLRLPLVLLICNYLFPCRPKKTSFPRKPSLKIIARSYSWLIPIIVVWTILHNICSSYTQYCTLCTPIESTNYDNFIASIMRMQPMNSKKKISTTYTYHIHACHINHITIQWFRRFRGSNIWLPALVACIPSNHLCQDPPSWWVQQLGEVVNL